MPSNKAENKLKVFSISVFVESFKLRWLGLPFSNHWQSKSIMFGILSAELMKPKTALGRDAFLKSSVTNSPWRTRQMLLDGYPTREAGDLFDLGSKK